MSRAALDRLRSLASGGGDAEAVDGWLDLLAERPERTGHAQALMESGLVARIYERWWRPAFGRFVKGPLGPSMAGEVEIARELIAGRSGDVVLDVACGTGAFTRAIAADVAPEGLVVGTDISQPMLRQAVVAAQRERTDGVAFARADAGALPFTDGTFHGVVCFGALHLMADPLRAIDEICRVLAPGGRVALFTSIRRLFPRAVKPLVEAAAGLDFFEPGVMTTQLDANGLRITEDRPTGVFHFIGAERPETREDE